MGRDFFAEPANVARLMTALTDLHIRCPVFLKVSPLGGVRAIEALLEAVDGFEFVSGFVFNLAPGKPDGLATPHVIADPLPGACAGKPVERQMNECIREMYRRMDRSRYRIIGIGGVFSGEDAYRKIRLGASLVQILTALVYEGPGVVKRINRQLCRCLERDGFTNVAEAVGTDNEV
jgi:dihydroorotate dehydrogenase (fumarate)/dihydroorotate dehydrogenase